VLIVIGLSRLVGLGCRWIKQPLVIGEIIAGIMLGPSLFGLVAPGLAAALFPAETVPFLNVLSQVGLIFFMFLIGLELNPKYLSGQLEVAVLISHVSILVPFSGKLLAVPFTPSFECQCLVYRLCPVFWGLCRLRLFQYWRGYYRKQLASTRLTLALTCAAVDDVSWCVLALAIAVAHQHDHRLSPRFVFCSTLPSCVTGRWFLQRLCHILRAGRLTDHPASDLHAGCRCFCPDHRADWDSFDFGAFLLGAVMPKKV